MPALARQRCLNHPSREAAARCPECGLFYCRECITEHDDRVICASCLKKLAAPKEKKPRRRLPLWPAAQLVSGLLITWFFFYVIARMLLSIPDKYHEGNLWKSSIFGSFQNQDDD